MRYLLENGPTVEPLAPENMLCFLNGPLTGTEANMSGRMAIVTKSPLLQERHGEKDLSVIAIGQAGERLVRFAAWMNENDRASGRGGTGAVGGSKNLKAVVIKSSRHYPQPTDKPAFDTARRQALKMIMDKANVTAPKRGGLSVYGTNVLMNITSMPCRLRNRRYLLVRR